MRSPTQQQAGLTLIEVLIAVLVLAIGLLGIAGLQSSVLANNLISYQYTQAATLAEGMIERMRANRQAVLDGTSYALTASGPAQAAPRNCSTSSCSPQEQAAWDIAVLYAQIASDAVTTNLPNGPRALLPGGRASITCETSPCTETAVRLITIYWDANRTGATGTGCTDSNSDLRCFRLPYIP